MNNKDVFDNYLTNQYSHCEGTDFTDEKQVLALLRKNKIPIEDNLGEVFEKGVHSGGKILDLGCGYGNFLFFLQSRGYQDVTGVDISTEELAVCRRLFKSYKFHQTDINEYIHATSERFDVIYLSHVLEHIRKEDLFDFLEGVRRILTNDGMFIVVVPNCAAYFNGSANRYGDITHELGFTSISMRQVLTVAGFRHSEIRNFFGVGNVWLNPLRKITLFVFEIFIQILGHGKQEVHTPSLLAIARK
ncbi:MAG: class I SAM-dependent methyltransferase [Candidatus Moraniibacteriota bacterium]